MKQVLGYLLLAASLLLYATPAQATKLESWKFNANQNQFEFTTDEGVQPQAQLVSDPTRLVIDLPGVVLGRSAIQESLSGAIQSIRIGQFDRDTTRLVIELAPGYTLDPNQIKFRGITARQWIVKLPVPQAVSGVVVVPTTSAAAAGFPSPTSLANPSNSASSLSRLSLASPPANPMATIETVQLDGNQLVIRANQSLQYISRWDTALKAYRINISPAQLANSVQRSPAGSAIAQLKIRQENPQTVSILVQPAEGVQVGQVSQPNQRMLTLQLQYPSVQPATLAQSAPSTPPTPAIFPQPVDFPVPQVPRAAKGRLLVVIDPGHGGPDPGAVGIGGLKETDIVLDIGRQVKAFLQQQGVSVLLTRNGEYDLDLEPRVQMAEQANATVFVSIHANSISLSRPDVSGLETYYYQSGQVLAQMIHQSILQTTGIPDRGIRTARFYVLRKTTMPSVLVEVGFVTGKDDAARLSNSSYRTQMAGAIARGILQYLQRTARF
ncbi:N-acetylmuramoyl-L-alanine amidase [Leptodesmis sp.]|uniref:N-acetylmuramoyl-L-alanine amidase n=1 Tax=Leptodesmis sp. TaxID=3100501 RepID=UPI004053566B